MKAANVSTKRYQLWNVLYYCYNKFLKEELIYFLPVFLLYTRAKDLAQQFIKKGINNLS